MSGTLKRAMLGALVADAVCMPVHWYYDTAALDRDYPDLDSYQAPKHPHPDSILWRSKYTPRNKEADILHEQAKYWGQRGIHYHRFLAPGDNTLNYRLGLEFYQSVVSSGSYDPDAWLKRYIHCMRTPGWHKDTYVEEYHRAFFDNLARGRDAAQCGIKDIHIGGLTPVPFLLAALDAVDPLSAEPELDLVESHLALTHHGAPVAHAGRTLAWLITAIANGVSLRDAIAAHATGFTSAEQLSGWCDFDDRMVVGRQLTPACYLPDSFTASLYLAWKYHDDFSSAILANARCGGDNAHRGVVVGALLGAAQDIPERWLAGLRALNELNFENGRR